MTFLKEILLVLQSPVEGCHPKLFYRCSGLSVLKLGFELSNQIVSMSVLDKKGLRQGSILWMAKDRLKDGQQLILLPLISYSIYLRKNDSYKGPWVEPGWKQFSEISPLHDIKHILFYWVCNCCFIGIASDQ